MVNDNTGDIDFDNPTSGHWSLTPVPTPIPAALPLLLSGLGCLSVFKRRKGVSHAG